MGKILLVEDDLEFAELIVDFLASRSIEVEVEDDPFKALVLDLNKFDLVLLDLGLPGIDGLEVCKEFRAKSDIPIIISSARSSVSDKVTGLQIGADDYLPKPYDPDELYARIISILRRTQGFSKEPEKKDFVIDEKSMDVIFKGHPLFLTNAEYEVFREIVKNDGNVVSKEQILYASPSIESSDGKSLEMIISKVRQKIKQYSSEKHIVALRGRGYRIVC
jgi:two-component system OmpR family response regulator